MINSEGSGLAGRLSHVYWLGGGSGAGKTTIAGRLADRYGLRRYSTDDVMGEHARRSTAKDCPLLHEFLAMDMDQRWLNRSPLTMLETFHWFRGEGFDFIVDDLLGLPRHPPVVVEGFRLLPPLVAPLLAAGHRAVWLLPTPEFRRSALASRGSTWEIAGATSDPERARRNLAERERHFTDRLRRQTSELGLPVVDVEPAMTEDGLLARVASGYRL